MSNGYVVFQKIDSNYNDMPWQCYEYPTSIPNGKKLKVGDLGIFDILAKSAKQLYNDKEKRITGFAQISEIISFVAFNGTERRLARYMNVSQFNEPISYQSIGVPEIINSDQGSQYNNPIWTNYLQGKGIKISMDGKGRATDNIWIEGFWKIIKYNQIYLNPSDTSLELFEGVQTYIEYYHQKKHQGIVTKPNDAYYKSLNQNAA